MSAPTLSDARATRSPLWWNVVLTLLAVPAATAAIWVGVRVAGGPWALPFAAVVVALGFSVDRLDRRFNRPPRPTRHGFPWVNDQ